MQSAVLYSYRRGCTLNFHRHKEIRYSRETKLTLLKGNSTLGTV